MALNLGQCLVNNEFPSWKRFDEEKKNMQSGFVQSVLQCQSVPKGRGQKRMSEVSNFTYYWD